MSISCLCPDCLMVSPLAQGGNNALRLVALLPQQILGKIGQRGAQQRREWQWPRDVDGARLR
jgi:hypothetical protein